MNIRYGVEMKLPTKDKNSAELVNIIDRDGRMAIVTTKKEATQLAALYDEKNLLEDEYTLYHVENIRTTELFSDYGLISESGKYYLYKNLTIPFLIEDGDSQQIKMALLQIDENLVASTEFKPSYYFVDRDQKELIEGYAKAYEICVSFFED